MNVFVAVAESEGFAAAARRLEMSPPAVTRAITALEEHLNVKLLNRTTRHVRVTEAGQRYLDDCRRILTEVTAAEDAATGINAAPSGLLTVTAPVLFGRLFVLPGITEYLKQHPDTQVSAYFLDRVVNLLEEGIDVGVRIGELPDSSMRALRVGSVHQLLCAAPGYLEEFGCPNTPEDLTAHTIITATASDWHFNCDSGNQLIKVKPRLTVTSNDAAIDAAERGLGITRLLSYQVAPQLADGRLVRILPAYEPSALPIHILHREGRFASAKIRTFVDLLAEQLRANPALDP